MGEKERGDPPIGVPLKTVRVGGGGGAHPPETNAELPGFSLERAHLLLQGVYRDFPHHNDGSHLDGGVLDDAVCQCRWSRMDAQSTSWYTTPSGALWVPVYGYNGRRIAVCHQQEL